MLMTKIMQHESQQEVAAEAARTLGCSTATYSVQCWHTKSVSGSHLETHLKTEASHKDEVTDGDDISQTG